VVGSVVGSVAGPAQYAWESQNSTLAPARSPTSFHLPMPSPSAALLSAGERAIDL
jgi:hypothetical protein